MLKFRTAAFRHQLAGRGDVEAGGQDSDPRNHDATPSNKRDKKKI